MERLSAAGLKLQCNSRIGRVFCAGDVQHTTHARTGGVDDGVEEQRLYVVIGATNKHNAAAARLDVCNALPV